MLGEAGAGVAAHGALVAALAKARADEGGGAEKGEGEEGVGDEVGEEAGPDGDAGERAPRVARGWGERDAAAGRGRLGGGAVAAPFAAEGEEGEAAGVLRPLHIAEREGLGIFGARDAAPGGWCGAVPEDVRGGVAVACRGVGGVGFGDEGLGVARQAPALRGEGSGGGERGDRGVAVGVEELRAAEGGEREEGGAEPGDGKGGEEGEGKREVEARPGDGVREWHAGGGGLYGEWRCEGMRG